jgi:site-specific recombinase XerD
VPLESLLLPEELSGTDGRNRGNSTTLAADNDLAAINAWLANFAEHAHTIRSYRKESERFLLWSLFEVGKPISSLSTEDCQAYQRFLGDVGKTVNPWPWRTQEGQWVGKKTSRWSKDWRPFAGPLAAPSRALSVSVVKALLKWLTEQNYLRANPWRGIKRPADATPKIRANHSLTVEQWQAVMAMCDGMERTETQLRLRFILLCGYWTGFRLSELAAMTISNGDSPGFRRAPDGDGYDIEVVGKRNKLRSVPMAADALLALMDYMESRGFGRVPGGWVPGTPLIATLGTDAQQSQAPGVRVSEATLYRVLKEHFVRVSRDMDTLWDADHLARASTHWLRHTHATHALQAGAEIYAVQENLGHASVATTAIYSHAGHKVRKAAIEKMKGLGRGS